MADFEARREEIEGHGAWIVAGSSDSKEVAQETVEALNLKYVMVYGLDPGEVSKQIGCYTGERKGEPHIQPTSFILDSRGKVVHAVYSSGKTGRLTAEDAIAMLEGMG